MLISLNKIKEYVQLPADLSTEQLIELIGTRLVEVEEVIDWQGRYQDIYVVKVVTCEAIPETHLHLCRVDCGERRRDLADTDGLIQVVCGAPNVHAGMLAVWIAPGAIVPETYGNENFKLGVRKLRGYESNGMLAGADELGFDTEHKAIAEIDPKTAYPGDPLTEVFDLDDVILDVENKSLTHRPDCFGLIGFAREVAGILGLEFVEPPVFAGKLQALTALNPKELQVEVDDTTLCPRYSCAVFDLPKNEPSKYLTADAVFLAKSGMRAIDPMVDLTNILMLETGQPLHAFDYDKLVSVGQSQTPRIVVRAARPGETLQLLDGKTIECIEDDILITSNNVPIALAGAMGGKNTEIDTSTKRVVLESATFSLYHLRKTQMAHGIFSEAITRFTKGQPAATTGAVLEEAIRQLDVQPQAIADFWPDGLERNQISLTVSQTNQLLGTDYDVETIQRTLTNVGFEVKLSSDQTKLQVTVPAWRTDVHIAEDVIEEVGRLLGYDNIPLTLPDKPFVSSELDPMICLKRELRRILSDDLNMHELLTYSFVSRQLLEKVGKDPSDCYEIVNSISPELQCFRPEIVPSLLDKVRENLKSGHQDFTLYEINQVSRRSSGLTAEQTPVLETHLGIVGLCDFYTLKAEVLALFHKLNLPVEYQALSNEAADHHPYLEPKRSADLLIDHHRIGAFGEFKLSTLAQFKLQPTLSALEINLEHLLNAPRTLQHSFQFSKFPAVERDLTVRVAGDMPFGRILNTIDQSLAEQQLIHRVQPSSIYQAPDSTTKNLSFHLRFSSPDKTLDSAEISDIIKQTTVALAHVGAEII